MKTLKTVAGTLQGETCIEMAALIGIGHCQDRKVLWLVEWDLDPSV